MNEVAKQPIYIPKSIGQVLGRTKRLLRANVKLLVGISVLPPALIFSALGFFLPQIDAMLKPSASVWEAHSASYLISIALAVNLVFAAALAPALAAASNAAISADCGNRISFWDAYSHAFARFGRYFLLLIMIGLISTVPFVTIQLAIPELTALIARISRLPGMAHIGEPILAAVASLACCLFVMLRLSLAFPSCVAEDLSAIAAIKRSNRLANGAMGKIFIVLLVVGAVTYAAFVIGLFAMFLLFAVFVLTGSLFHFHLVPASGIPMLYGRAMFIVMAFGEALVTAGNSTALAVIYNDQSLRKGEIEIAGE